MTAERWQAAYAAYERKILTAARNSAYISDDHDVEDMVQELLVVLWECCSLYDPERGMSFNSFFWMRAQQRVGQLRNRAQAQCRRAEVIQLDEEALADVVNERLATASAEELALAGLEVREVARGHIRGIAAYWRNRSAEAIA